MALVLASLCQYVLYIGTKRTDPLLDELSRRHFVTQDLGEVMWTPDDVPIPPHRRVVFWPRYTGKMTQQQRLDRQAAAIRKALDWADDTGGWAVVVDELMWVTRNLRLERELEAVYFQGRTQGVSLIGAAQRPSHVPLLAFSQATYIFLWQTGDRRDIERLREISSGFPPELIEETVKRLDWRSHEALFIDTRRRELARVIAPAELR